MGIFKNIQSKTLNRREFAELLSESFADAGVETDQYNEEDDSLQLANGNTAFLQNVYAAYVGADRSRRKEVLKNFVAGFAVSETIPSDFVAAEPRLIPTVRSASYFSLLQLQCRTTVQEDAGKAVATQNLSDDLVIALAYDTERTTSYLNEGTLAKWQVSFADVFKASLKNLRDRTDTENFVETAPGLFVGVWNDSYETSRVLLADVLYRLSVLGDPVIAVPTRDQLWVTGSKSANGIEALIKLCWENHFGAYPLSPYLYQLCDGKVVRFVPESRCLQDDLSAIERRRLSLDYTQQKTYLEAVHENSQIDIFVASFSVFEEKSTGQERSLCVWSKGIDSLLPVTDDVALLIDPSAKVRVVVPWSILYSIVGERMEPYENLQPMRHRVRSFPRVDQIDEIRAAIARYQSEPRERTP